MSRLHEHYEEMRSKYPHYNNIICLFETITPFLEPIWEIIRIKKNPLGGRPRVSRLALFLSFLYLLYYENAPINRVVNKINADPNLLEILALIECTLDRKTLSDFVDSLYDGPLTSLFDATVILGLKDELITLNEHVIDAGKVIANVNNSRYLSFPTKTHLQICELYSQIDFSIFAPFDIKKRGKRYSLITRVKLLFLPYIAGLGSFTTVYKFLETYPYFKDLIGLPERIPSLQCMRTWISNTFLNSNLEKLFQTIWFQLVFLVDDDSLTVNKKIYSSLDDFFGLYGSKYSRVDRGARVGYKPSDRSWWIGYKDHVSVDKETGVPIHVSVTGASVHDTREYISHLKYIKKHFLQYTKIEKSYGDRGYDSIENREACKELLNATPCISKRKPSIEQKLVQKQWSSHRQIVEQTIGKAKDFLRKNNPRYRGKRKVDVWVRMSYLILLIFGLSCLKGGEPELVQCLSIFHH